MLVYYYFFNGIFNPAICFSFLQRVARLPKGPTLYFKVLKVNTLTHQQNLLDTIMGSNADSLILDCFVIVFFKVNVLMHPGHYCNLCALIFSTSFDRLPFCPQYSLIKDVISSLKKHRMHEQQFTLHPLLILSNFGMEGMHVKLMATMFQHMFPSINVQKVCLGSRTFWSHWYSR